MARFDVFPHPDTTKRGVTPFLLDVQNNFIDKLQSRVVIPLRAAAVFGPTMRDLNPLFTISGQAVVLDTAAIAALPKAPEELSTWLNAGESFSTRKVT